MSGGEPASLTVSRGGWSLAGESAGEGAPVVLLHGISATRRYVLHGSKALARAGHTQLSYDARGHGDSDPAPSTDGYGYPQLVSDLDAVVNSELGGVPLVLVGHSMGAHTAVAYALQNPAQVAGLVLIGPVYTGVLDAGAIADWDRLAEGLEQGGVDGFVAAIDHDLDPDWRETVLRIARQRMEAHRHPAAVARALREVPRSAPFDSMSELEFLEVPALVVASRDVADPGHPYAVAAAYVERLPLARLISEEEGASPLAWQGGRLAREIASFCDTPEVEERIGSEEPYA
jgi:pimeloyl-ACP methyl ester carboxylesterase